MIQNVLMTALTPLSCKTEIRSWENQPFKTVWPEDLQQKTKDVTRTIKKKPKRVRTAFSTEQLRILERTFSRHKYIDSERRVQLAKSLNIEDKCIKIWFQNRRMKEKRESSESSSESSSETLGNETPSVTASPPLQMKPDGIQNENVELYPRNNPFDYSYQLPTYYGSYGAPANMYESTPSNYPNFYNDYSIYPTQYFPVGENCSPDSISQYSNEMHSYWASNQNPYYAPI